jgi:hypothetical protein
MANRASRPPPDAKKMKFEMGSNPYYRQPRRFLRDKQRKTRRDSRRRG